MKRVRPQGQVEVINAECERQDPDSRFLDDYLRELIYGGIPDTVSSGKD